MDEHTSQEKLWQLPRHGAVILAEVHAAYKCNTVQYEKRLCELLMVACGDINLSLKSLTMTRSSMRL